MSDLYLEQREMEIEAVENGVRRYYDSLNDRDPAAHPPEMKYVAKGMADLVPAIEDIQRRVSEGAPMRGMIHWGIPLISLDAERIALITLATIFNHDGESQAGMLEHLAEGILLQVVHEKAKYFQPGLVSLLENKMKGGYSGRTKTILRNSIPDFTKTIWTKHKKMAIGAHLLETVLQSTDIVEVSMSILASGRWGKIVRVREDIREDILQSHSDLSILRPMLMPMIVPPQDWTTLYDGGYLIGNDEFSCISPLVKVGFKNHLDMVSPEDTGLHVDAVNHLQKTAWTVNRFVADTVDHIHTTQSEIGHILKLDPTPLISTVGVNWDDEDEVREYKQSARAVHEQNRKTLGSRRLFLHLKATAKAMNKYDRFYFQWQMGFRGRFYPRFCGMDPQGDKINKSYLKFAEGKPLTDSGYRALTIHLANCMGYDKLSLDERVRMVEDNADEIHKWAEDPLSNTDWTLEDTTVTLAAAKEWSEATLSGDPASYVSHLPIPLDGKCNGLQHLSALARDPVGAFATCLTPDKDPQDIYTLVWNKVDERIEDTIKQTNLDQRSFDMPEKITAENVRRMSNEERALRDQQIDSASALFWRGNTSRPLVKRGAMTWGYGVTEQGIMDQLVTDGFVSRPDGGLVPNAMVHARFMRDCIYWAVNNVVVSARTVMEWLQDCASLASSMGKALYWTNPAGMRVHQEYLKPEYRKVETVVGHYRFRVADKDNRKLAKRRQRNGIAPNFVHSIDAAHMTNVILRLKEEGITDMHMIHDSFAAHACHYELLNRIVREEFVKIHSANLLQKFKEEVEEQLGVEVPDYPKQGDFDVRETVRSVYAFS
jgi:DNA-directed RNA polymerase